MLGVLPAFIGADAVADGLGLALDPSSASLGTPSDLLEGTPFATLLILGIVLFAVNEPGSLAGVRGVLFGILSPFNSEQV